MKLEIQDVLYLGNTGVKTVAELIHMGILVVRSLVEDTIFVV
jgi:hypothetical protein